MLTSQKKCGKRLWVLGASDPEMAAIQRLLADAGEDIAFAAVDGTRVYPGNAYRADGVTGEPVDFAKKHVILVECGFSFDLQGETTWIDHHRPGDPGYGKPPAEYWKASSLGQVVSLLADYNQGIFGDLPGGWFYDGTVRICVFRSKFDWTDVDHVYVEDAHLIAAADHCLSAAYRGDCPGVDPDELMRWRVSTRAAFQGRPETEILADVEAARVALRSASSIQLGGIVGSTGDGSGDCYCDCGYCDRGSHCGEGSCDCREGAYGYGTDEWARDMRGQHVSELPEASAREGLCFIADGLPGQDGRVKVICQSGSPEQISAFLQEWAPANGLIDCYGDPARGFAGGYVE